MSMLMENSKVTYQYASGPVEFGNARWTDRFLQERLESNPGWHKLEASSVHPVTITEPDLYLYPANSPSLIGSLHDISYSQGVLLNADNYCAPYPPVSRLDVCEIVNGNMIERELIGEPQCKAYLDVSYMFVFVP
jgi:hypothetical protein